MDNWQFSESIGNERIKLLYSAPEFEEIVERISKEMEVLCCHFQPCDDNSDFSRITFNIRVSSSLFDLFFNSSNGYRGAYFQSPNHGLQANDIFIQRISPLLLNSVTNNSDFDFNFAKESLISPSAKVWLAECGSHNCERCKGEWSNPIDESAEILNNKWEKVDSSNGLRGRKAAFLTKLRVFGAFLDTSHNVFVPVRKCRRAEEIHECGWS
jgi:hypothetical protein